MLLIAGATGRLGRELLRRLDPDDVLMVLRGPDPDGRAQALGRRLGIAARAVGGDVSAPDWGLGGRVDELRGRVHMVVNLAADTGWGSSWDDLARVNVRGAEHGVRLAARLDVPVLHVSTLFVGHGQPGVVPEDLVLESAGLSDYERSKCRGEWVAADAAAEFGTPLLVTRVGGLVDPRRPASGPGRAPRARAPFGRLIETSHRLAPVLYDPDARIDLLPVDLVAAALARVLAQPPADGVAVRHLAACQRAAGVAALVAESRRRLRALDGRTRPTVPVRGDLLLRLSQRARSVRNPVLAARLVGTRYLAARTTYAGESLASGLALGELVDCLFGLDSAEAPAVCPAPSFYAGWPT